MTKIIVSVTCHAPTEAIKAFDAMPDWHLVVILDEHAPKGYKLKHGTCVTPKEQEQYDRKLSDAIGWHRAQRRNIGLLIAHEMGAEVVAVVDDDNIPLPDWGIDLLIGKSTWTDVWNTDLPVFDPLFVSRFSHLWHRGFPLPLVGLRAVHHYKRRAFCPDVQADLWNGDPDIDAICRMTYYPHDCDFGNAYGPVTSNKMGPFNSQNTFISAEWLKHYFLFPSVGRIHDIWTGYYLQALGAKVVWNRPSVYQARNKHDIMADFVDEQPGYEHGLELVKAVSKRPEDIVRFLKPVDIKAFHLYQRHFK